MLKNKENIKKELKEKLSEVVDEYVESMDNGFKGDSFHINEIENLWTNALTGCTNIVDEGTQTILDNISEKELISKKKEN